MNVLEKRVVLAFSVPVTMKGSAQPGVIWHEQGISLVRSPPPSSSFSAHSDIHFRSLHLFQLHLCFPLLTMTQKTQTTSQESPSALPQAASGSSVATSTSSTWAEQCALYADRLDRDAEFYTHEDGPTLKGIEKLHKFKQLRPGRIVSIFYPDSSN